MSTPKQGAAELALLVGALAGLASGGALWLSGLRDAAGWAWAATTLLTLVPTVLGSLRELARGHARVDWIAVLAMAGALALGEHLAGAVIAFMLAGGAALEHFAIARARRELSALLQRAPVNAHRRVGSDVETIAIDAVRVGDRLVVKPGEVVPADGVVLSASAVLDESALSGEARPVSLAAGDSIRSGGMNAGAPLELRVVAPPAESTYAGIVRLVSAAEQSKAPFLRLADRYALVFLALTLAVALAAWLATGDAVRALAVLVVATPCPLILAAPAALIAGVSCAARHGVIIKGGGPLETLARTQLLLLDKTGTLTSARPQVVLVESFGALSTDALVALAASVEQLSTHPFAPAIVNEARQRGLSLREPEEAHEQVGTGIAAQLDGQRIAVGQLAFVAPAAVDSPAVHAIQLRTSVEGSSAAYVGIDGRAEGVLLLQDPIRVEAPRTLRALRKLGIEQIHMVTGDHPDVAELVGDAIGVDRVFAERTPEEKTEVVRLFRPRASEATGAEAPRIIAMVGDGINDAPALALADVGIAMGARGATAASEAADVVLTSDRLQSLVMAVRIAQRTRRIALESVIAGMAMSLVAMLLAALGLIAPTAGAVLQEGIDVLVILNALRALGAGKLVRKQRRGASALSHELTKVHKTLAPRIGELASTAAKLDQLPPDEARATLEKIHAMLEHELLPHERAEQETAYPALIALLDGEDPTGPLVQTHHEIQRLTRLFGRLVHALPASGAGAREQRDLQRVLYGLSAVLSLHFAQEEELYSLFET